MACRLDGASAVILLIGSLGTNFSEILVEIQTFSFKKMQLKMSSAKWHPFCLDLNVLSDCSVSTRSYSSLPIVEHIKIEEHFGKFAKK